MRFVIQVCSSAEVETENHIVGKIGKGFLVFIGIGKEDNESVADKMIKKMLGLRIFADDNGKTNRSLNDVGGELLLVSQFTLYADCRKGNRPSFTDAGSPGEAERLYHYIIEQCRKENYVVETGIFGADMKVSLVNEGPFTILLDDSML